MKKILLFTFFLFSSGAFAQAIKVEVKNLNGRYMLYRNNEPYFVKGAAGFGYYNKLKEYGGNSLRVWNTDNAEQLLNEAHQLGLTVTLGLYIRPERLGMDYTHTEAVNRQKEEIKKEILKYKDHPALLMWGIGNELELHSSTLKFWNSIDDLAKMIHELDPNHPTTTMLAGAPEKDIRYIKRKCKNIDLLSFNVFKELPHIPYKISEAGWDRAYLISEWGPTGYWETTTTKWNAFIEETSTDKATLCKARYEASIKKDPRCIGSYVFLWGTKQERTPTLFSMFLESGQEIETTHVMKYLWTGEWPANKSPQIKKVTLNNKHGIEGIYLKPSEKCEAFAEASDPDDEQTIIYWAVFTESNDYQDGGDGEQKPEYITGLFSEDKGEKVWFVAPPKPGAYRLYVYVYDGHNNVATGNIPFYVNP